MRVTNMVLPCHTVLDAGHKLHHWHHWHYPNKQLAGSIIGQSLPAQAMYLASALQAAAALQSHCTQRQFNALAIPDV